MAKILSKINFSSPKQVCLLLRVKSSAKNRLKSCPRVSAGTKPIHVILSRYFVLLIIYVLLWLKCIGLKKTLAWRQECISVNLTWRSRLSTGVIKVKAETRASFVLLTAPGLTASDVCVITAGQSRLTRGDFCRQQWGKMILEECYYRWWW